MTWFFIWLVIAFITCPFIGKIIRFGMGEECEN